MTVVPGSIPKIILSAAAFIYFRNLLEQRKKNILLRTLYTLIKLSIAVTSFWFIYREVFAEDNLGYILEEFWNLIVSPFNVLMIAIIFFLMIINWTLEAWKWKLMIQKIEAISFSKSFEAILSGLTVSFFTPNRIGEFAGRVFHLQKSNRIQATLITILENISQLVVTITAGAAALFFYARGYLSLNPYIYLSLFLLLMLFIAAVLLIYFEVPLLDRWLLKRKFMSRLKKYFEVLALYSTRELSIVLLLAAGRYLVFTFQYYLLLRLFGITTDYLGAIILIGMIFFVMTLIPTFALTEIGVRGAVATFFLSKISYDTASILNATVSLWMINLVIPSLAGIIFVFRFRFKKQRA